MIWKLLRRLFGRTKTQVEIKYPVNMLGPETSLGSLKRHHDTLLVIRRAANHPSERLLSDIATLEHIMNSAAPTAMAYVFAREVEKLRKFRNTIDIPLIDVARSLGWEIKPGKFPLKN